MLSNLCRNCGRPLAAQQTKYCSKSCNQEFTKKKKAQTQPKVDLMGMYFDEQREGKTTLSYGKWIAKRDGLLK